QDCHVPRARIATLMQLCVLRFSLLQDGDVGIGVNYMKSSARPTNGLLTLLAQLAMRRERRIAKVAMARKLAVRLYWLAEAMGLPADEEVRFAHGRARKSPGC